MRTAGRGRGGGAQAQQLRASEPLFPVCIGTHARSSTTDAPDSHFSLAAMSQRTSACGQYCTALRSRASRLSLLPCAFSSCAARRQIDFFPGNTDSACA